jgi:hypothetical protein
METAPLTAEDLININIDPKSGKTPTVVMYETDINNIRNTWKFISLTDYGEGKVESVWDVGPRMIMETRLNGKLIKMHIQDKIEKLPRQKLVVPWRD